MRVGIITAGKTHFAADFKAARQQVACTDGGGVFGRTAELLAFRTAVGEAFDFGVQQAERAVKCQIFGRFPVCSEFRAIRLHFGGVADNDRVGTEIKRQLHIFVIIKEYIAAQLQTVFRQPVPAEPFVVPHIFRLVFVGGIRRAEGYARAARVVAAGNADAGVETFVRLPGDFGFGQKDVLFLVSVDAEQVGAAGSAVVFLLPACAEGCAPLRGKRPFGFGKQGAVVGFVFEYVVEHAARAVGQINGFVLFGMEKVHACQGFQAA